MDSFLSTIFGVTLVTLIGILLILTFVIIGWVILWETFLYRFAFLRELMGLPPITNPNTIQLKRSPSQLKVHSTHLKQRSIPITTTTTTTATASPNVRFLKQTTASASFIQQRSNTKSGVPPFDNSDSVTTSSTSSSLLSNQSKSIDLNENHFI